MSRGYVMCILLVLLMLCMGCGPSEFTTSGVADLNGAGGADLNGAGGADLNGAGGADLNGAGGAVLQGAGGADPQGAGGAEPQGAGGAEPEGAGGADPQGAGGEVGCNPSQCPTAANFSKITPPDYGQCVIAHDGESYLFKALAFDVNCIPPTLHASCWKNSNLIGYEKC